MNDDRLLTSEQVEMSTWQSLDAESRLPGVLSPIARPFLACNAYTKHTTRVSQRAMRPMQGGKRFPPPTARRCRGRGKEADGGRGTHERKSHCGERAWRACGSTLVMANVSLLIQWRYSGCCSAQSSLQTLPLGSALILTGHARTARTGGA